jgi:hypothetical protein
VTQGQHAERSRVIEWFTTYRPYITVVVAIALIVIVPRIRGDSSTSGALRAGGGASAPISGDTGSTSVVDGGTAAGPGGGGGGGGSGSGSEIGADGSVTIGGVTYPGVGSAAALANPRCDATVGRVKLPSVYAAECVAPWPAGADNGGATSTGVTADTIRIAVYENPHPEAGTGAATGAQAATAGNPPTRAEIEEQVRKSILLWTESYELWGRKLEIVFVPWTGPGGAIPVDEATQRADAVQVANDVHPFIATSFLTFGGATPRTWATELAARGVVSWDPDTSYAETHSQAGFRWGFEPDDLLSALHVGEYTGKRLWGHPAKWSGNLGENVKTRKFGIIHDKSWDLNTFKQTLAKYAPGASIPDENIISFDPGDDPTKQQQEATTQVARLKSNGVTTVINVGNVVYNAVLTRAAAQQAYTPEWIITGWSVSDVTLSGQLNDQSEWSHAFGVGEVPIEVSDAAQRERNALYQWYYGEMPKIDAINGIMYLFAKNIAAGLQRAGPNLTPETFRNAMFNSGVKGGRACGCITLPGSSYGLNLAVYPGDKYFEAEDYTEKWYDANGTAVNEIGLNAPGRMWFVSSGRRYSPGDWPTTEPDVFNPSSAQLSVDGLPPEDRTPEYPRPG